MGFLKFVIFPLILGLFISFAALILDSLIQWYIDEALTEDDMLTEIRHKEIIHAYTLKHYSFSYSACGHDNSSAES